MNLINEDSRNEFEGSIWVALICSTSSAAGISTFQHANLVVDYSNADDGKAFFDISMEGKEWFDEIRRFAGYRFLKT